MSCESASDRVPGLFDCVLSVNVENAAVSDIFKEMEVATVFGDVMAVSLRCFLHIANSVSKAGYQVLEMPLGDIFAMSSTEVTSDKYLDQSTTRGNELSQSGFHLLGVDTIQWNNDESQSEHVAEPTSDGDDSFYQPKNMNNKPYVKKILNSNLDEYNKPRQKRFQCLVCHKNILSNVSLRRHLTSHILSKEPGISCGLCSEVCRNAIAYVYHNIKAHKNSIQCSICKVFYSRSDIYKYGCIPYMKYICKICSDSSAVKQCNKRYIDTKHTAIIDFNCNICGESFLRVKNLVRHAKQVHGVTLELKCKLCAIVFTVNHEFEKHMRAHSRKPSYIGRTHDHRISTKCAGCGLIFHRRQLWNHGCHSVGIYTCPMCEERFFNEACKNKHLMVKHEKDLRCQCNICNKFCYSKGQLKKHMVQHRQSRIYKCHECAKVFETHRALNGHRQVHEVRLPKPKDICHFCGKCVFAAYRHSAVCKMNHTEKTIPCEKCGMKFRTKYHLNLHVKNHVVEKQSMCDMCGKSYKNEEHVRYHKSSVHCERKFVCEHCFKAFKIKRHMVTHYKSCPCLRM